MAEPTKKTASKAQPADETPLEKEAKEEPVDKAAEVHGEDAEPQPVPYDVGYCSGGRVWPD